MKRLYVTVYRYREGLDADDLRELTAKFAEVGTTSGVIQHYARLDGTGGFLIQDVADDPEADFGITIQYMPWMDFEVIPVATMEEAFPVIQRHYG
jgi:hypothetical protein